MTGDQFRAWMEAVGLNKAQAAARLGLSRNSVAKYEVEGAPIAIAYACAAVAAGLTPWGAGQ